MQSKGRPHLFIFAGALVSLLLIAASFQHFTYAQERFRAILDGKNEVPPVNSTAGGVAIFKVKDKSINSKINITGVNDISGASINMGKKGENGDPIVDLLKIGQNNKTAGGFTIEGNINASNLEGSMNGNIISDLGVEMASNRTYVNIQTIHHPEGELRGQIKLKADQIK